MEKEITLTVSIGELEMIAEALGEFYYMIEDNKPQKYLEELGKLENKIAKLRP